jgi:hypothetical protein
MKYFIHSNLFIPKLFIAARKTNLRFKDDRNRNKSLRKVRKQIRSQKDEI